MTPIWDPHVLRAFSLASRDGRQKTAQISVKEHFLFESLHLYKELYVLHGELHGKN